MAESVGSWRERARIRVVDRAITYRIRFASHIGLASAWASAAGDSFARPDFMHELFTGILDAARAVPVALPLPAPTPPAAAQLLEVDDLARVL